MNRQIIRAMSIDLEIPFSHLLAGYFLETLVELLWTSSYSEEFWMINGQPLGLEAYRKKAPGRLFLVYCGTLEQSRLYEEVKNLVKQGMEEKGLVIKCMEQQEKGWYFVFEMEEMCVPFQLEVLSFRQEHLFPQRGTLHFFWEKNKTVDYPIYPLEHAVAYHLMELLRQLELMNDMEHYLILYEILQRYPLEGRKVWDSLGQMFREQHLPLTEKPFMLWKSYGNYTYMKKKWKVFLRRVKQREPGWEQVHRKIICFLEPIWQAVMEDQVFFGDWMPELERFFF